VLSTFMNHQAGSEYMEQEEQTWVVLDDDNVPSRIGSPAEWGADEALPIRRTPDGLTAAFSMQDSLIQAERSLLSERLQSPIGRHDEISRSNSPLSISSSHGYASRSYDGRNPHTHVNQNVKWNRDTRDRIPAIVKKEKEKEKGERRRQRRESKAKHGPKKDSFFHGWLRFYSSGSPTPIFFSHVFTLIAGIYIGRHFNICLYGAESSLFSQRLESERRVL